MAKPRIVHVINGLFPGGAEIMLLQLLTQARDSAYEPSVVSLLEGGELVPQIEALGIPVHSLGMSTRVPDPRAVHRLSSYLHETRPAAVQAWMYHANLFAGLAGKRDGIPVAWGIHHTNLSPAYIKRSTSLIARAGAAFSSTLPAAIVCCAEASRRVHAEIGYDPSRMLVIPNGFDLARFKPDIVARSRVRAELGLAEETPVAGMLARFNPQKDHRNFVAAAELVLRARPDAHFVLSGAGCDWENAALRGWIEATGRRDRFHLLGRRDDTPAVHAALDVAVLSSESGEAFPLVIGEAMATGVPCAVTDVGDSALIVGKLGRVAPPRDPIALAAGVTDLLALSPEKRRLLGQACRASIAERFSLPEIARRYDELWDVLATFARPHDAAVAA